MEPEQFSLFDQHFWLFCALLWLGYPRLPHHWIPYSKPMKQERIELLKVIGHFFGMASIALWIIQLTSGVISNPFMWTWQSPQRWLALDASKDQ